MKTAKRISLLFLAGLSIVVLTSAFPSTKVVDPAKANEISVNAQSSLKDGKVTYKELKKYCNHC